MAVTLHSPDSVAGGLRLPEGDVEQRLRVELAVALYAQAILSLGKAAELAGLTRDKFGGVLADRGVARHYTEEELAEDVRYARGK